MAVVNWSGSCDGEQRSEATPEYERSIIWKKSIDWIFGCANLFEQAQNTHTRTHTQLSVFVVILENWICNDKKESNRDRNSIRTSLSGREDANQREKNFALVRKFKLQNKKINSKINGEMAKKVSISAYTPFQTTHSALNATNSIIVQRVIPRLTSIRYAWLKYLFRWNDIWKWSHHLLWFLADGNQLKCLDFRLNWLAGPLITRVKLFWKAFYICNFWRADK